MAATTALVAPREADYRWDGQEQSFPHWRNNLLALAGSQKGGKTLVAFLEGALRLPCSTNSTSLVSTRLRDTALWGAAAEAYQPLPDCSDSGSTTSPAGSARSLSTTRSGSRAIAPQVSYDTVGEDGQQLDQQLYLMLLRVVPAERESLIAYPGALAFPWFSNALVALSDTFQCGYVRIQLIMLKLKNNLYNNI